jgi:hypothetical protein
MRAGIRDIKTGFAGLTRLVTELEATVQRLDQCVTQTRALPFGAQSYVTNLNIDAKASMVGAGLDRRIETQEGYGGRFNER